MTFFLYFTVPPEIEFRGQKAQFAYEKALRSGSINVYRGRIFLIGQDRAGKTSLKKSLVGLPFNPNEQSTEGIQVDHSTFEVDVEQVKNWKAVYNNEQGLLGCAEDVAKVVIEKDLTATAFKADEREEDEEDLVIGKKFEDEGDDADDEGTEDFSMSQV